MTLDSRHYFINSHSGVVAILVVRISVKVISSRTSIGKSSNSSSFRSGCGSGSGKNGDSRGDSIGSKSSDIS